MLKTAKLPLLRKNLIVVYSPISYTRDITLLAIKFGKHSDLYSCDSFQTKKGNHYLTSRCLETNINYRCLDTLRKRCFILTTAPNCCLDLKRERTSILGGIQSIHKCMPMYINFIYRRIFYLRRSTFENRKYMRTDHTQGPRL